MSKYAQEIIAESVSANKQMIQKRRRDLVNRYLDYYDGDNTYKYIKNRFKANTFQEIPPSCFNITKRFIERLSRLYTGRGAVRNVSDQYENLTLMKNGKMAHIERMTRLIGTIANRVVMKYDRQGKPYFDYYPLYYFDAFFDDDPFAPVAIMHPLLNNVYDISDVQNPKWAYWDDTNYIIYDEDGNIEKQTPHGLDVLPFVFTHRNLQMDDFIVSGSYDVISCNEGINILLTEANLGMRFQMFGQPVATGMYSDENVQRYGSDEMLVLPEGSNFNIVSPSGQVQDAIELCKTMIDLCAQNNHLYVQFAQDGGEVPSGVALKIKDLERYEDWQSDLPLWEGYEHQFFEMEKMIADIHNVNISGDLKLDFLEPEYPKTAQDQILLDTFALEQNMTTQAKLMVRNNKDLTLEEAQKIVDENKQVNNIGKPESIQSAFGRIRQTTTEA